MRFWPIFANRCRSVTNSGCSFEIACDFLRGSVVAIPENRAAESRRKARVRATATPVDTNATVL